MTFGDDGRGGQHDEYVQFGRPWRRGRGGLTRLLLVCLVVAGVVAVAGHVSQGRPPQPPPATVSDRGQITRTRLPQAEGDGAVSFIVGPRQAIIRPLDNVPGYVVPDGQPPAAADRNSVPWRAAAAGAGSG